MAATIPAGAAPPPKIPKNDPRAEVVDGVPICSECGALCVSGWNQRNSKKGAGLYCNDCAEE